MPERQVVRSVNEAARDVARDFAKTEAFAHSRHDRGSAKIAAALGVGTGTVQRIKAEMSSA